MPRNLTRTNSASWVVKHSSPWMYSQPITKADDRILEWRQPPSRATCSWGSSTDEHGNRTSPLGLVSSQASFPRSKPFDRNVWMERQRALRLEQMASNLANLSHKDARAASVAVPFGRTSRGEFGFSSLSTLSTNSFDSGDFARHGADKPWTPPGPGISRLRPSSSKSSMRSRFGTESRANVSPW